MKKQTRNAGIGFLLILLAVSLAWWFRELLAAYLIIPAYRGFFFFIAYMNVLPQIFWWLLFTVIVIVILIESFRRSVKIQYGTRRRGREGSRLHQLSSLVAATLQGATYSWRQLALLLTNIYRNSMDEEHLTLQNLPQTLQDSSIPAELRDFIRGSLVDRRGASRRKRERYPEDKLKELINYIENLQKGDVKQ